METESASKHSYKRGASKAWEGNERLGAQEARTWCPADFPTYLVWSSAVGGSGRGREADGKDDVGESG